VFHDEGAEHRAGDRAGEDRQGCQGDGGGYDGSASARSRARVVITIAGVSSPLYPLVAFFAARAGQPARAFLCMAAIRSFITYLALIAYIAVVGPVGLLIAFVFRWKAGLYALGHGGVWLALTLAGIRYKVIGREHIPRKAVVFCSNHESNVDPAVLFQTLHRRLHILYKAELHKFPIMGTVFDVGGFVAVDRLDREKAIESISLGARSLRSGNSFLIFPEGTRSRSGQLLPFKKGGFIMAIEAQVPVVPVAVSGGRAAMRKGSAVVRPVMVTVRIGQPIPTAGLTLADRDDLIQRVRDEVQKLLLGV
jgi:1-acyl-sn-glycerol-3-phosphate acyltransferase